jgi:hypothetical protein
MGLDMYLYAKRYLADFRPEDKEKAEAIQKLFPELAGVKNQYGSAVKVVQAEVGYWRKANAIHDWFVQEVQDGEDKCRPHYVDREKLVALKALCEQVLADKSLAHELLPTTAGFFFGGTDYDDWYFESLESTIEIIDAALKLPNDWDFEYQSSW